MKKICVVALLATVLSVSQLACSSGNQANTPANNNQAQVIPNAPANANNPNQNTVTRDNANTAKNPFTELVMLYSQLFTARMKGDKAKVESLLADDYKETTADGKVLNRAQVLAAVNDSRKADPFSMDGLKSTETGDTGTVTGRISVTGQGNQTESWEFNTTFKKQQDKWRAASTKITNYKKT